MPKKQVRSQGRIDEQNAEKHGHLQCPFCNCYDVSRMFVASFNVESCECLGCGARWDEDARSGEYLGRLRHPSTARGRLNR